MDQAFLNQLLTYWRAVAQRAWTETIAAHNWKAAPLIRRVLAFGVLCVALLVGGSFKPLQDKLEAVVLVVAALVAVFVLEILWRIFAVPAHIAVEQAERIETLEARNAKHASTREIIAKFEQEFGECTVLQERLADFMTSEQLTDFRNRVEVWDKRVHALIKEYFPPYAFGYASIATLPHGRGFSFLGYRGRDKQRRLTDFIDAKRMKLRSIVMRLEGQIGNDE